MTHEIRNVRLTEADRTFAETTSAVEEAIREQHGSGASWLWVRDLTDEWAVYEFETDVERSAFRIGYTIDGDGAVTLVGEPVPVEVRTEYKEIREAVDTIAGRVLEAKEPTADGGRVFAVEIIQAGTSRNGRRYTPAVLKEATPLYDGVKAFDHHRTIEELQTSSIDGLVGHYRNPRWTGQAIAADLHVLPSAGRVAEALQMSLDAQGQGLPPVVGISHDVIGNVVPKVEGNSRILEATAITEVRSADVVADPSAGGRVTRLVAGGFGSDEANPPNHPPQEKHTMLTFKQLMDKLREANADERAALLKEHAAVLEGAGYTADDVPTLLGETEETTIEEPPVEKPAEESELVGVAATESYSRDSIQGGIVLREAVSQAGLSKEFEERIRAQLPERFTESDVTDRVELAKQLVEGIERDGLSPRVPHITGGADARDKARARLEATFGVRSVVREGVEHIELLAGGPDWQNGFTSITEAYLAVTGASPRFGDRDLPSRIVRESWSGPTEGRMTEALDSASWGEVLADVMHKRMVADYRRPNLQAWRPLVNVVPVADFRSQKVIRVGGYGTLPTVLESGTFQPLTSPGDEQATYSVAKKGGTESYTFEMAKNDDLRQLVSIPGRLARAAAMTLHYEVFGPATGDATGIFTANPTIYDSVALFDAGHANTTASTTLGNAGLNTLRQKMRDQAAYGDSVDILGLTPKFLLVPNELEDAANQLCYGDKGVPSTTPGASDVPNLHQGLTPIVVDSWTDANDYIVAADPADCPGIEIGFLDGQVEPELFLQDDPSVGSVFTADQVTWKIRHIWAAAVVDYRAFQRMTN